VAPPLQAVISIQNVGETLQQAVTTESKVKLGFLEIPIGAMFGIFGRITQGPRLSGSVHKQENEVALIARIEGGGFPSIDWRVDRRGLSPRDAADRVPLLTQLVEQLACRIFTDLVPNGSKRWQAVYHFSQGLKSLRITTRTETDKFWNLRQAEEEFIQALAEDGKFGSCYYNLGIVYRELGQPDAARVAYAQTIRQDPAFAPAYYALALNRWNTVQTRGAARQGNRELYSDCISLCDQAIALDPDYASAWDLKGLAYRRMREAELGKPLKAGEEPAVFKQSNKSREIASALAWRAVCQSSCLLYTSPSPRDLSTSRMPSSA